MKVPSEADLQELENRVLHYWRGRADALKGYEFPDRIVATLESLIAIARDPSQLLPDIPDDDLIDRSTVLSPQPPRTANPEPVPSLEPKPTFYESRMRKRKK